MGLYNPNIGFMNVANISYSLEKLNELMLVGL